MLRKGLNLQDLYLRLTHDLIPFPKFPISILNLIDRFFFQLFAFCSYSVFAGFAAPFVALNLTYFSPSPQNTRLLKELRVFSHSHFHNSFSLFFQ